MREFLILLRYLWENGRIGDEIWLEGEFEISEILDFISDLGLKFTVYTLLFPLEIF